MSYYIKLTVLSILSRVDDTLGHPVLDRQKQIGPRLSSSGAVNEGDGRAKSNESPFWQ